MIKDNYKKAIIAIWLGFFIWFIPIVFFNGIDHGGIAVLWAIFSLVPIIIALFFVLINLVPEVFKN